jgi:electron transfer flavoprotein alpha/beta subunit
MNIIVCIKQVPNVKEVKWDPVTGSLIRKGIPRIINPNRWVIPLEQWRDEVGYVGP